MEKSLIHSVIMFPTCNQSPIISEPGNRALNLPTAFVTPKSSAILSLRLPAIGPMRDNKLNALFFKFTTKLIRIISFVTNQMLGFLANFFKSLTRKLHLRRTGSVKGHSQRNTFAVCQYHELRALATLGFADVWAPFFAEIKLPSMKHSPHWIRPFLSKVSINFRQIFNHVPFSSHNFKRLQQVLGLGYRSGKSFHLAPVRKIQRMPSSVSRFFFHGLPLLFGFGNNGSTYFHCFSLRYTARLIGLRPSYEPFIDNHLWRLMKPLLEWQMSNFKCQIWNWKFEIDLEFVICHLKFRITARDTVRAIPDVD